MTLPSKRSFESLYPEFVRAGEMVTTLVLSGALSVDHGDSLTASLRSYEPKSDTPIHVIQEIRTNIAHKLLEDLIVLFPNRAEEFRTFITGAKGRSH